MVWPIVITVAALSLAAVVVAFLVDRASAQKRREIFDAVPDRPELDDSGSPHYVRPRAAASRLATVGLSPDERAELQSRLEQAAAFSGGWAAREFVNDPPSQLAILRSPVVLVAGQVSDARQLYPAMTRAKDSSTGLVVVAEAIDRATLAGLVMNAEAGTLPCVAVVSPEGAAIARGVGSDVVSGEDLFSGYLPEGSFGHCESWVSSGERSWVLGAA